MAGTSPDSWMITPEDRAKHDMQFNQLSPVAGFITGEQARGFFMQSGLKVDVLGHIWDLADMDKDGRMNRQEFSIAMFLIKMKLLGNDLPRVLPQRLKMDPQRCAAPAYAALPRGGATMPGMQPAVTALGASPGIGLGTGTLPHGFGRPSSAVDFNRPTTGGSSPRMAATFGTPTADARARSGSMSLEWAVPQQSQLNYAQMFHGYDRLRRGHLLGLEAKDVLLQTGVPRDKLALIWALSDVDRDGRLTQEEFTLAMHLIDLVKAGKTLAAQLPPELVPPSYRSKAGLPPASAPGGVPFKGSQPTSALGPVSVQQPPSTQQSNAPADPLADLLGPGFGSAQFQPEPTPAEQEQSEKEKADEKVTFEDKRIENFRKGQAELEKRQAQLREQQEREKAERLAAERAEQERKERIRMEQERRRQQELEKQLQKQREQEQEREEQRRKAMEQREAARREMERQRQLEWERQRKEQLLLEKSRESDLLENLESHTSRLKFDLEALDNKKQETTLKISQAKGAILEITEKIEKMRNTRDTVLQETKSLNTQIPELNMKLEAIEAERRRLKAKLQSNSPILEEFSTVHQQHRAKSENVTQLKKELVEFENKTDDRLREIADRNNTLLELTKKITQLKSRNRHLQEVAQQKQRQLQDTRGTQFTSVLTSSSVKASLFQELTPQQSEQTKAEVNGLDVPRSASVDALQSGTVTSVAKTRPATVPPKADSWADLFEMTGGKSSINWDLVFAETKTNSPKPTGVATIVKSAPVVDQPQTNGHDIWNETSATSVRPQFSTEDAWPSSNSPATALDQSNWPQEKSIDPIGHSALSEPASSQWAGSIASSAAPDWSTGGSGAHVPASSGTWAPGVGAFSTAQALPWESTIRTVDSSVFAQPGDTQLTSVWPNNTISSSGQPLAFNGKPTEDSSHMKPGYSAYKALFPFDARQSDELTFTVEDIIMVPQDQSGVEEGWMRGEFEGRAGLFPETYVELMQQQPSQSTDLVTDYEEVGETTADPPSGLPSESAVPTNAVTNGRDSPDYESFNELRISEEAEKATTGTTVEGVAKQPHPKQSSLDSQPGSDGGDGGAFAAAVVKPSDASSFTPVKTSQSPTEEPQAQSPFEVTATQSWKGKKDNHLTSFSKGDTIEVLQQQDMWWLGRFQGRVGWFPQSFVKTRDAEAGSKEFSNGVQHSALPRDSAADTGAQDSSISATAASTESGQLYVAMFDYDSTEPGDLALKTGDMVRVSSSDGEWWTGHVRDREGIFPANYVKIAEPQEERPAPGPAPGPAPAADPTVTYARIDLAKKHAEETKQERAKSADTKVQTLPAQKVAVKPSVGSPAASDPARRQTLPQPTATDTSSPSPKIEAAVGPLEFPKRLAPSPVPSPHRGSSSTPGSPRLLTSKASRLSDIVRVIAPHTATGPEQLTLQIGNMISVRKRSQSGWWEGELHARGTKRRFGWFPADYVVPLNQSSSSARNTPVAEFQSPQRASFAAESAITAKTEQPSVPVEAAIAPTPAEDKSSLPSTTATNTTASTEETAATTAAVIEQVVALYDYSAINDDELSFRQESVIQVLDKTDKDWWRGELNGKVGLFPSNYVRELSSTGGQASY